MLEFIILIGILAIIELLEKLINESKKPKKSEPNR